MNIPTCIRDYKKSLTIWVSVMIASCLMTSTAFATIVQPIAFDVMTQQAELIIEGRVTKIKSYEVVGSKQIWTDVTFEILDTIKGNWSGNEIQLSFLGGKVAEREVQVAGMFIPALGETGIYFIASTDGSRAQPLLGWHQGHVVIKSDLSGKKYVFTADNKSIVALDKIAGPLDVKYAGSAALGLRTSTKNESAKALSVNEFKSLIQTQLSISSAQ